jgi:hypothetical protein
MLHKLEPDEPTADAQRPVLKKRESFGARSACGALWLNSLSASCRPVALSGPEAPDGVPAGATKPSE